MSKIENYQKVIDKTQAKIEQYNLLVEKIDRNDATSKDLLAKYKKNNGSNNKIEKETEKLQHNVKKRAQVLKNIEEFKTVIANYEGYIQREKSNA
jgi:iron uptake system EfeUOB component EfeO/EfeM